MQDEAPDLGSRVSALHVSARSRNFFHCLKFLVSLPGVNLEVQDKVGCGAQQPMYWLQ